MVPLQLQLIRPAVAAAAPIRTKSQESMVLPVAKETDHSVNDERQLQMWLQQRCFRSVLLPLAALFVFFFHILWWQSNALWRMPPLLTEEKGGLFQSEGEDEMNNGNLTLLERFLYHRNQSPPHLLQTLQPQKHQTKSNDPIIKEEVDPHWAASIALAQAITQRSGAPWDNMDFTTGHAASCGFHKCFFRSSPSSSFKTGTIGHHPTTNTTTTTTITPKEEIVGYLLSVGNEQSLLPRRQAFRMEQDLVTRYGILAISWEEPHVVPLNNDVEVCAVLDAYTHIQNGVYKAERSVFQTKGEGRDRVLPTINVQRVRPVPTPNLLVGFLGLKKEEMKRQLPTFVQQISNLTDFQTHYQQDMDRQQRIVADPLYERYLYDYHVLLTTDGDVYCIDLDGHFSTVCAVNVVNGCIERTMTTESLQSNMTALLDQILLLAAKEQNSTPTNTTTEQ